MGYKKKILVILICISLLFSLSLSAFAISEDYGSGTVRADIFGILGRISSDGNVLGNWLKIGKSGTSDYPFSFGQTIPAGQFFQSMVFMGLPDSSLYSVGYTYSFDIEISFQGAGLSGYFFLRVKM